MKFLLVNKFHYKKGGSETYYFSLEDALKRSGHEVVFFAMEDEKNEECPQSKYFVSKSSTDGGLKNKLNMVLNMTYSKEAYKKMSELLDEEKPDVAILNLVHKQITCSIIDALKEHNVKIVWTMHDLITICPAYTMLDGNGNICEKCSSGDFSNCYKNRCIRGSRLLSFLSKREAEIIKKHKWYNDVDLYICPSYFYKKKLDESHFTESKIIHLPNLLSPSTNFKIKIGSGDYASYFGRLTKEKGLFTLIDSAAQIKHKVFIVGTGPQEDELKAYVKEKNITNIVFTGFKSGDELQSIIDNSKCVILPSEWYENGPYSAMEAMASGKPLIVSNAGGLPELVNNGENGYIFEMKNSTELAKCIDSLFSMKSNDYDAMCHKSLEMSKNMFYWEKYVSALLEEISKI